MRKKGQILRQQAKTAAVIALVAICTSFIAKEVIKAIILIGRFIRTAI